MHHIIFELLENAGFLKGFVIQTDRIARAKRSELISVAEQSAELTPASSISNIDSIYSHTASPSLGGGPTPCVSVTCRTKRARELVQFAAFYSDRVFVNNNLFATSAGYESVPIDAARRDFLTELEVLLVFRPLIEAGIVVPVTPKTTLCYHCLGKSSLPKGDQRKFDRALQRFARRFETETDVMLNLENGQVDLNVRGSDELVEHGFAGKGLGKITKLDEVAPNVAKRLRNLGRISLSRSERKEIQVDAAMAHRLFNDVGFEMGMSQCLKASVVTSRQVDVEILKDFAKDTELSHRNALIEKHLTCLVPFLNDVSTAELLDLRRGEADAFISFRQVFAKAVDEHIKTTHGRLTDQDAAAIFKDVLQPELARLNRKVASASKSICRKSGAGLLGWAAALSAGFYFGFVESSLVAAANALGLTKVAADLATSLLGASPEDEIRQENMYYLWKVEHRAQGR
jgi:hypothetical protein